MKSALRIAILKLAALTIAATGALGHIPLLAQDSKGAVKGVVFDVTGAVAPHATITVKNTRTGDNEAATTQSDGTYRIVVPRNNRYEIVAELPGFFRETCVLWVPYNSEVSMDFVLRGAPTHGYGDVFVVGYKRGEPYTFGRIQGQVIGEFGGPVSRARVVVRNEGTGWERAVETRKDGTFIIVRLPEGRYDVKAEAEGYEPEHLTAVIEYAVDAALKFELIWK